MGGKFMTKKKFIVIPIIILLLLSFSLPIVNADNENNTITNATITDNNSTRKQGNT